MKLRLVLDGEEYRIVDLDANGRPILIGVVPPDDSGQPMSIEGTDVDPAKLLRPWSMVRLALNFRDAFPNLAPAEE